MTRLVYIYQLRDPRDWRIRYIGRTCRPKVRLKDHMRRCTGTLHRDRWLTQLKNLDLCPIMELVELCAGNGWDEERQWIARLRKAGVDLVNKSEGGFGGTPEGNSGRRGMVWSEEHRRKLSESKRGKVVPHLVAYHTGRAKTIEWRKRHSEKMKGHAVSLEQREKLRDSNKRFWSNPDVVAKHKEKTSTALAKYFIGLSPEQKKLRHQKMSDNAKKLTPYKRTDEHTSALSHRKEAEWKSMTKQDREIRCAAIQRSCSTSDEKKRRSLNAKKYWSSMTGEQREEMRRRISEGRKRE